MGKKLSRILGLLLCFIMLTTDFGSIVVSAVDNDGEVNRGETVSEDVVSGNEAVSDNETEDIIAENETGEEEESASENEAVSENEVEEKSTSENEAEEESDTGDGVTESQIKIKEVKVEEKGYYRERIKVTLENPGKEKIERVEIVEKGIENPQFDQPLYYDEENDAYIGVVNKREKDLELRVSVYAGQGELSYVKEDFTQDYISDKDIAFSVSFNEAEMNLLVTGEFTPYYKIDDLYAFLYYKKSTSPDWDCAIASIDKDGSYTTSMASHTRLDPNEEYKYYLVIQYYDGEFVVVRSEGSKDEPNTYKSGVSKTYSAEDFKDKALYNYLKDSFGENNLTTAYLESKTSFIINTNNEIKYVMKSLEDIPEKMPNLMYLTINSQDISVISPLLKMKYLRSVNLNYNDISTLPDLSGIEWTYLSLNNNLLDYADIDAAKIPSGVNFCWSQRIDDLKTSDVYYIDTKGVYPIILEYRGKKNGRKYTAKISINDVEKIYDYRKETILTVTTAKEDFNLEEDKYYKAKIVINDGFDNVFDVERGFKIEKMSKDVDDIYGTTGSSSVTAAIYIPAGEYANEIFSGIEVKLDDKVYFKSTDVHAVYRDRIYDYYRNVFDNTYNIKNLDYNSIVICNTLSMVRFPVKSDDYDLVLNKKEGNPEIWEKKVHITSEAVVTGIKYRPDGYDSDGAYYFIELQGYNFNEKDIYPVITDVPDGKGNEYTKLISMVRTNERTAVYKLQKKDNWAKINKASDGDNYFIIFRGDKFTDKTSVDDKIFSAINLKDKAAVNLYPIRSYYNWKTKTFEFVFDSTVKKGTKLNFTFYKDQNREVIAAAQVAVGDKGITSVKPILDKNTIYTPEYIRQYYSVSDGKTTVYDDFDVELYNWSGNSAPSDDYFYISKSKTYLAAPGKEIDVSVHASASRHKTDMLYAKIKGTDEKKEFTCNKEDTFAFDAEKWEFSKPLEVGDYTIAICEVVEGKEVELGTTIIYVRDKSKFYASYISGNLYRNDLTKAQISISMPFVDVPNTDDEVELKKVVEDLKLKIEIFDGEFKPVSINPVPYNGGGDSILFKVNGLDKDVCIYYVRITAGGKIPLKADTDKEYYDDKEHGICITRSSYFGLAGSTEYNAYCCLYASDLENLPPFTLNFYAMSMPDKLVKSITVKKDDLEEGDYYFTKKDVEKLDSNTVYNCIVMSKNQRVLTYTGFFASRDNGAAYNPNKITLKVNKKEWITATLVLNTNGGTTEGNLYTMAKNCKSAKMTKLTKRGYTFKGWYVTYTDKKGKEKQKKVTSITAKVIKKYAVDSTLTLDAVFTPNKYSISYKKTAPAKKVKVKGKIKLAKEEKKLSFEGGMVRAHGEELSAEGYKLIGWTTVKNGPTVIAVGEEKPVSELIPEKGKKITFYPIWAQELIPLD